MSIRKMLVAAEAANLLGLGFFEKERDNYYKRIFSL